MSIRNYTYLQKTELSQIRNIEEYKFQVDTTEADQYRDELVAGIVFKNHTRHNECVVLSIYTYHLREGFRNIELGVNVSKSNKKIVLEFKLKSQPGEIPNFDDNVGDNFLGTLLDAVSGEFSGQGYVKKRRNLFRLIEKLQWKSEESRVKTEQAYIGGTSSIVPTLAIVGAVVTIGLIVYFKLKK